MTFAEANCAGRHRFTSAAIAHAVARRGVPLGRHKRKRYEKKTRVVYRCPGCGGWHLGRPS